MKKWLPLLTLIVSPAACDNPTDADLDEQPAALVSVVSSSRTHTCATHAGALWCWGDGTSGQLGDGGDTIRNTPRRVQGLGEAVVAVAAGDGFTCAIERGALYCWGANDFGQLGVGTSRASATPTLVSGMASGVQAVVAQGGRVCAIKDDTPFCWGLGQPHPRPIASLEARSIAIGSSAACVSHPGGVRCVPFQSAYDAADLDGLANAEQLWWHRDQICARIDGTLQCGQLNFAHLVAGEALRWEVPPRTLVAGGVSNISERCVVQEGRAMCRDTHFNSLREEHIAWFTPDGWRGARVSAVAGECAATPTGVTCVGYSGRARATLTSFNGEVFVVEGFEAGVTALSDGQCVVQGGGVHCFHPQLRERGSYYARVAGLESGVTAVSGDSRAGCAILEGGELRCWGSNEYGQRGLGTLEPVGAATTVPGFEAGVEQVTHAGLHVCAVRGGRVHCWGYNHAGWNVPGCEGEACPTPHVVAGLHEATDVIAGTSFTCASGREGLLCWGDDPPGEPLGGGLVRFETGKTQRVVSFDVAGPRVCALLNRGGPRPGRTRGVCRSNGSLEQDELNFDTTMSVAREPSRIVATRYHTCVVGEGQVSCWGLNGHGELGVPQRDLFADYRWESRRELKLLGGATSIGASTTALCGVVAGALRCYGDPGAFLSSAQLDRPVVLELPSLAADAR